MYVRVSLNSLVKVHPCVTVGYIQLLVLLLLLTGLYYLPKCVRRGNTSHNLRLEHWQHFPGAALIIKWTKLSILNFCWELSSLPGNSSMRIVLIWDIQIKATKKTWIKLHLSVNFFNLKNQFWLSMKPMNVKQNVVRLEQS